MRIIFVVLCTSLVRILFAQNAYLDSKKSYYINNQNDTVFGLIKLNRKSESFRFVKDNKWDEQKIHHSEAHSLCKDGVHFVKQSYKGRTKFLRDMGSGVFQYQYKKEKFYNYLVSDDIYWPNNGHPEMKYKYKVIVNDTPLFINRFNYQSILKTSFGLSNDLAENCHFYEFEMDILELKD